MRSGAIKGTAPAYRYLLTVRVSIVHSGPLRTKSIGSLTMPVRVVMLRSVG